MELITKAEIIQEFVQNWVNDYRFEEYFEYNDLGIPLAVLYLNEAVLLKEEGKNILNETYAMLCDTLGIDKEESFLDYEDFIEESDIEPLEEKETE
jgi:hypothetical protein